MALLIGKAINQSINQSTDQSINQSVNQWLDKNSIEKFNKKHFDGSLKNGHLNNKYYELAKRCKINLN